MITLIENSQRLENYQLVNRQANTTGHHVELFQATNTIIDNLYSRLAKKSVKRGIFTSNFAYKQCQKHPGRLGCSLSWINILKKIESDQSGESWFLIFEDDISVPDDFAVKANNIVSLAKKLPVQTRFIRLFCNFSRKYHHPNQWHSSYHIAEDFYWMTRQWGTVAQIIHKSAASVILSTLPLDNPIDIHFWNKTILSSLNPVTYRNSFFQTLGALDSSDNSSKFGSFTHNI